MARGKAVQADRNPFDIHEDKVTTTKQGWDVRRISNSYPDQNSDSGADDVSDGSGSSESSDDSSEAVDPAVLEDIAKFEATFQGINQRFKVLNRIGEGTFSVVYKAEDLLYEHYYNDWDLDSSDSQYWVSPPLKKHRTSISPNGSHIGTRKNPQYVAIKKIYVTSSPIRIQNELELLHDLKYCKDVCPLITAFRHQDQVVAILPYYRHQDFRDFFRIMAGPDIQLYFRSLFRALAAVHKHGILHRDIKPTNFLYDPSRRRGVLVDFGLAEREGTDSTHCLCGDSLLTRRNKIENSHAANHEPLNGYPKNDTRQSKRANRAGTRGFRAPEVLFKCTNQTPKIDVWSAGVILLTILSRRFPFFNSADDIDAMVEIATIFGHRRMKACALLHGAVWECTLPTVGQQGFSMEKLILWSTCRTKDEDGKNADMATEDEKAAIKFLERCLEVDPKKRISAKEALEHPFLVDPATEMQDEESEMEIL